MSPSLEEHTQRPGLPLLLAGAVVVATAAAMWWRDILIWPRSLVLAIASPRRRYARSGLSPTPPRSPLQPGHPRTGVAIADDVGGLKAYGALVVCVVALIVAVAHLALRAVDRRTARATTSPD